MLVFTDNCQGQALGALMDASRLLHRQFIVLYCIIIDDFMSGGGIV